MRRTYDKIAFDLASGTRLDGRRVKVVDVVVEDDVDATSGDVLLCQLAVFLRVGSVEQLRVRVDDRDLLARISVLDLARGF